jgi:hypothetical protein
MRNASILMGVLAPGALGGAPQGVRASEADWAMNATVNLVYWGAPRNDGFVLMPNEVEAYRVGPKAFEFKGTNGFMLTLDLTSKDVAARKGGD